MFPQDHDNWSSTYDFKVFKKDCSIISRMLMLNEGYYLLTL